VIVPDVNILVHAHNVHSPDHAQVKAFWHGALVGSRPVGLSWVAILGFLRITTHRSIFKEPLPVTTAARSIRGWLSLPNVEILTPGERHAEIMLGLIEKLGTAGDLTTDAHLAALAIEYHAELVSTDADFARFRGLRWFNPTEVRK
jgi:toxin-antitoxin system PIN domain toxin